MFFLFFVINETRDLSLAKDKAEDTLLWRASGPIRRVFGLFELRVAAFAW